MRGLREDHGSWNTAPTVVRYSFSLSPLKSWMSSPFQHDLAARWALDPQHQLAGGRFAAARLTHQPQGLAIPDDKAYSVHSLHMSDGAHQDQALCDWEILLQVLDPDQRLTGRGICLVGYCHEVSSLQQLAEWAESIWYDVGYSAKHWSRASGQRGANRHPGGRSRRRGGCPSMEYSHSTRSSSLGTDAIKASV